MAQVMQRGGLRQSGGTENALKSFGNPIGIKWRTIFLAKHQIMVLPQIRGLTLLFLLSRLMVFQDGQQSGRHGYGPLTPLGFRFAGGGPLGAL